MTLPRLFFTVAEVAEAVGVSRYWLREQARTGRISAGFAAGAWRFSGPQLDALVEQIKQNDRTPAQQPSASSTGRPRSATRTGADSARVLQLVAKPPRRRRA
ncbi:MULTISPECIES: helix-turn-helix domain-containing protein [Streptomyces]|uniref:helix-turn-helix domain-containing protein n=1 Tax=Streptomyces TaxID=1883 RepID=UPI0038D45ED7